MPHDLHHPFYILELKFISFNIYGRSYKSVFIILNRSNDTQRSRNPFFGFSNFLLNQITLSAAKISIRQQKI